MKKKKKQMFPKIPREIGQLKKATGKRRRTLGNRAAMLALHWKNNTTNLFH